MLRSPWRYPAKWTWETQPERAITDVIRWDGSNLQTNRQGAPGKVFAGSRLQFPMLANADTKSIQRIEWWQDIEAEGFLGLFPNAFVVTLATPDSTLIINDMPLTLFGPKSELQKGDKRHTLTFPAGTMIDPLQCYLTCVNELDLEPGCLLTMNVTYW